MRQIRCRPVSTLRRGAFALNTEALRRYSDVIDLSIGDTDFTTDRRVIDAAYR